MAKSEVITRTVTMTGDVVRTKIIAVVMLLGTLAKVDSTTLNKTSVIRVECRISQAPIIELSIVRICNHIIGTF